MMVMSGAVAKAKAGNAMPIRRNTNGTWTIEWERRQFTLVLKGDRGIMSETTARARPLLPNEALQVTAHVLANRPSGSVQDELELLLALGATTQLRLRLDAITATSPVETVTTAAEILNRLGEFGRTVALTAPLNESWHLPLLMARARALHERGHHEDSYRLILRTQQVSANFPGVEELERKVLRSSPELRTNRQAHLEMIAQQMADDAFAASMGRGPVSLTMRGAEPVDAVLPSVTAMELNREPDEET